MAGIKLKKLILKQGDNCIEMAPEEALDCKLAWFFIYPEPSPLVQDKQIIPRHLPVYYEPHKEYVYKFCTLVGDEFGVITITLH